MKRNMSPDTARQEYQEVCTHQEAMDATMFQTAISAACYHKNRYPNILPLESTRVKLSPKEGAEGSDYINANFIFDRKYIACQAPLFSTIGDFWRMAWEQRTAVIIMLTKLYEGGRVKANLYWPMSFEYPLSIDDMTLTLCHQEEEDNRIVRVILLQKGEEVRRIYHLQYSGWPDFGTPETATGIRDLVKLMFYYRECGERENLNGPVVVHCSAGVGRSGSFIAIAHLFELIIKNQNILPGDVMATILEMRSQRPGMVQTESQYSFIYQALEEELCFLSAVKSLENPMKKKRNAGWRNRSTEGAHSLSRDISVSTA